ncbi:Mitochondrial carrier domain containing protein [Amanita muscaria]
MSAPSSLRDLYVDPSSAWAFEVPKTTIPTKDAGAGISAPAYQWSTRPPRNSVFELSPSLDFSEPSEIDTGRLLRTVVASALLQYTSTAIANPWEVGKLLLQVQWVPRDAGEPETPDTIEEFEEDALSDGSNEDAYFADPNNTPTIKYHAPRPTDEQGYVIRRSVMEEGTRPEYIIPVGSAKGVWGMIKRVATFRGEGWLALWKGLLTSCVTEVISSTIQPLIHNVLQSIFFPSLPPFHQPPIFLPVASHLITGFILSPLDLIRTRLIVQSYNKRYRTYSGPLDALSKILREEGGLMGIYFHSHLLLPSIIDNTLRPLVSLAFPGMLTSLVDANITEESNPISWGLVELCGSCIGLLITLPFDTVRKRLQVQVRGTAKPIKSCVELRPTPYNGIVDAFWHILTEERSDLPIKPGRRRRNENTNDQLQDDVKQTEHEGESWLMYTGIGQLYRGLGMRLSASVIVFFLAVLSGGQERDSGWAEI